MKKFFKFLFFFLIGAIIFLGATSWWLSRDTDSAIFVKPERDAATEIAPPASDDSRLVLAMKIPYAYIQEAMNKSVPLSLNLSDSGHLACGQVPYVKGPSVSSHKECAQVPYLDFRGAGTQEQCIDVPDITGPSVGTSEKCADYDWRATAERTGGFTVSKSADRVRIGTSLKITGKAGAGGDLAKLLSLSGKNFQAKARPAIDVKLGLTNQWCPNVDVTPTNDWIENATVEVVGKNCAGVDLGALGNPEVCAGPVNVDLTGKANDAINSNQAQMKTQLLQALSCDNIRKAVSDQWKSMSIPLGDTGNLSDLFINIVPTAASFSGAMAEDDALRLTVQMQAQTSIGPKSIAATPLPLPPLGHTADVSSRLSLNVPVRVMFGLLGISLFNSLPSRDFSSTTAAGDARLHIDDTEIYSSHGALVVGIKIIASLPGRLFDTSGWVYLIGKPVVNVAKKTIKIDNLHYATVLDNAIWSDLSAVFNSLILTQLKSHSEIDISEWIKVGEDQALAGIAKQHIPGLNIAANRPTFELRTIEVRGDGVWATSRLDIPFSIEMTQNLLIPANAN